MSYFVTALLTMAFANAASATHPVALLKYERSNSFVYIAANGETPAAYTAYIGTPGRLEEFAVWRTEKDVEGTKFYFGKGQEVYVAIEETVYAKSYIRSSFRVQLVPQPLSSQTFTTFALDIADPTGRPITEAVLNAYKDFLIAPAAASWIVKKQTRQLLHDGTSVVISNVYRDANGNLIVETKYQEGGPLGTDRFFWGPRGSATLYQFRNHGFTGSSVEYTDSIGTIAGNKLEFDNAKVTLKDGIYTITHEGVKRVFKRVSEAEEVGLENILRSGGGAIKLVSLPRTRVISDLFKVQGSDQYILIDASRFFYSKHPPEVFIGEANKLRQVTVYNHDVYLDGGTSTFKLSDGSRIVIPAPRKNQPARLYTSGNSEGAPLEKVEATPQLLKALGIAANRYKMPKMMSPVSQSCDVYLQ